MGNRAARWPSSSPSSSLSLSSARRAGSEPESGTSQVVPHTPSLALLRARVPVQSCPTGDQLDLPPRGQRGLGEDHHRRLGRRWLPDPCQQPTFNDVEDRLERFEIDWKMLFLKEQSGHKNWRGFSKVRLGFLGWSTAASPVRKRQSSGTGPARKADVDSFSHRLPPNFD